MEYYDARNNEYRIQRDALILKFIFGIELYMFRTGSEFHPHPASKQSAKPV